MSNILESKIIDLGKITILLKRKNGKNDTRMILNIYDDNVLDNTVEYESIDDLNIRVNKKIKLFN